MQKGKEQAAPYSPLLFLHYIHSLKTCVASLLHTFKLKTFKPVKVHLYVQSHQLVHRSDTHCCGHMQEKLVYICVLYCTELYQVQ